MDRCSGSHAVRGPLLKIPKDAVVLPVRPVLQCHYSLMCPLGCVNTVYINILMLSFHVAPWCAQLACGRNLSSRMPLSFEPERAPSGLCKYCLYQYTHIILSCCTLVCPIGMWARPEQSNAPRALSFGPGHSSPLNLSALSFATEHSSPLNLSTPHL